MKKLCTRLGLAVFAFALAAGATFLLTLGSPSAEAGGYLCPSGECWTSVFGNDGCFHCLINPAPAHCSCSAPGTCPTSATECGNCGLACDGGVIACSDNCPGCTHHLICPPAKGRAASATTTDNTIVEPIRPTFSEWIDSQPLLNGVSAVSPLMREVVLHMRQVSEQWGCSQITGLVVDPSDAKHVQSKIIIHSNEAGITTFTIFNRSTDQDETLIVHGAKNMWQLRTEPSYASGTPRTAVILAQGNLDRSPGGRTNTSTTDNTMVEPIRPTFPKWINSQPLLNGVSAVSPLMREAVLHMRRAKEEWTSGYITGLVVDPSDAKHVQSKIIIHSNEAGITTFMIFNRSTDQDETLIVHGGKNMWQLRTEPSYASGTPRSAVILAQGNLVEK